MNNEPILILANPKGKAWEFANKIYQKLESKKQRERIYNLGKVDINKFNDGEIFTKILENVRKKTCFYIQDSSMNSQDWLVSLGLINDALERSSAGKINNVLPYMKYARQDRMTESRTPISIGFAMDVMNQNTNRVLTTDLHNPASTVKLNIPCDNLKAYLPIINYLKENYSEFLKNGVIVAPDIGGAKRAESYAKRLGLDVALAHKKREKAGEVGDMTIIGNVEGKNALIVDDMIDTGGTLCKAAEKLKQKGTNQIYAAATHGIFSKGTERFNESDLEKLIITDSIPQKNNGKIEIVSLANLYAEAIHRISHGESISELYE